MKYFFKNIFSIIFIPVLLLIYSSCKVEPILDPNNPGLGPISANPTLGEIQNLVTGIESGMRDAINFYLDDVGVIGREFYRFSTSDPRFTSDALAARVDVYKSDWSGAITDLGNSFFDINGDLSAGAYYLFSSAGGDQLNPMFFPQNSSGETRVAEPSFITDAQAGDTRLSKAPARTSSTTQDGLTSSYDFFVYKTNVDKIPIIRNEELLLIYAEANAQLGAVADLTNAVTAINKIRSAAGLPAYSGAVTQTAIIDEMLKQRRYSLYGEGHRWIDMRRYDRLNTLPIARAGDDVWTQFPRPATE